MKNVALIVFFAALTGLVVWIAMGGLKPQTEVAKDKLDGEDKVLTTEKDFVDKLTEIKMRRDRVKRGIVRLERQKSENIDYLKSKGISKVADAQNNPDALIVLKNLKEWNLMLDKRNKEVSLLDKAISRLEGMLSEFRRANLEKSSGLTDDQLVELIAIQQSLDDRLGINENDILQDMELDELLDAELGKQKEDSDQELLESADGGR